MLPIYMMQWHQQGVHMLTWFGAYLLTHLLYAVVLCPCRQLRQYRVNTVPPQGIWVDLVGIADGVEFMRCVHSYSFCWPAGKISSRAWCAKCLPQKARSC